MSLFNYSDRELFNNVSFQINQGEHVVSLSHETDFYEDIVDYIIKLD